MAYSGVKLAPEDRPKWMEKIKMLRNALDDLRLMVNGFDNAILRMRYDSAVMNVEAVVDSIENFIIGDQVFMEQVIQLASELGRLACQFSTLLPSASEMEGWYNKPTADELERAERVQRDLGYILDDLIQFLAIEIGFNLDAGEGECIIKPRR